MSLIASTALQSAGPCRRSRTARESGPSPGPCSRGKIPAHSRRAALCDHHDALAMQTLNPTRASGEATTAPAPSGHRSPCAYPSHRRRDRRAHSRLARSCVFNRADQCFQDVRCNIGFDLQDATALAADLDPHGTCRTLCCRSVCRSWMLRLARPLNLIKIVDSPLSERINQFNEGVSERCDPVFNRHRYGRIDPGQFSVQINSRGCLSRRWRGGF